MVKLAGTRMGKNFRLDKHGKPVRVFIPRDASQKARWAKQPKTIKVARHQRRGT